MNGQYQPHIEVVDGAVALLRMLHAVGTRAVFLKLDQPELCTLRLIARDGIFQQGSYLDLTKIVLIQATRADIAMQCNLPAGSDSVVVNVYADDTETVCCDGLQCVLFVSPFASAWRKLHAHCKRVAQAMHTGAYRCAVPCMLRSRHSSAYIRIQLLLLL